MSDSYATYLTARLAALGLSRNALARALGHRGASQVSRWCAGKAVPREKARAKIEAALDRVARVTAAPCTDAIRERLTRFWAESGGIVPGLPPETHQDAPGSPISGGEDPTRGYIRARPTYTFVVERHVVEGG